MSRRRTFGVDIINPNYDPDSDEADIEKVHLDVKADDQLGAIRAGLKFARQLHGNDELQPHPKYLEQYPELAEANSAGNS